LTASTEAILSPRPLSAPRKAQLVGEVLVTYLRVRLLMRRGDVRVAAGKLRAGAAAEVEPGTAHAIATRLTRAIISTLEPLPADSRCLMRSLVLMRMLARRGVSSQVVIGVSPGESFAAHAWVEHDGRALLPDLGLEPLTKV
jgi:Transglutaminase-like superfamily